VPTSVAEPLLNVDGLESGYGKIRVLHGIDLQVSAGEVVALLGPNGAGKTTLLRALSGLLPVNSGHVNFAGHDITNATPRETAHQGLVHVIEGHRVFTRRPVFPRCWSTVCSMSLRGCAAREPPCCWSSN
jgi:branched-chain amino acid transport system ATP-binding protein